MKTTPPKEATFNPETNKGTFTHRVHHGEVLPGTMVPTPKGYREGEQKLAAEKGTEGAMKSLKGRYGKTF